jgi:hypothetical protein
MKPESRYITAFLITALIIVILGPFAFIWSLNTLFGLTIGYGFFEWLAGLILLGYFKSAGIQLNKSS